MRRTLTLRDADDAVLVASQGGLTLHAPHLEETLSVDRRDLISVQLSRSRHSRHWMARLLGRKPEDLLHAELRVHGGLRVLLSATLPDARSPDAVAPLARAGHRIEPEQLTDLLELTEAWDTHIITAPQSTEEALHPPFVSSPSMVSAWPRGLQPPRRWEARHGRLATVERLCFHHEGHALFSVSDQGEVCLWRVPDSELLMRRSLGGAVSAFAVSPNSSAWVAGVQNALYIFTDEDTEHRLELRLHNARARIKALCFHPTQPHLFVLSVYTQGGVVYDLRRFDVRDPEETEVSCAQVAFNTAFSDALEPVDMVFLEAAFGWPDRVIFTTESGAVLYYDEHSGLAFMLRLGYNALLRFAVSPGRRHLAFLTTEETVTNDGSATVGRVRVVPHPGLGGRSPDSGSWETLTGVQLLFLDDNTLLHGQKRLSTFELDTQQHSAPLFREGWLKRMTALAVSPDRAWLAWGNNAGRIQLEPLELP